MLILSNGKRAAQGAGTARFFRTLLMRVQIVRSVTGKDFDSETKIYLSFEMIFIGPESDHWQCLSMTNRLTPELD